MNNIKFSHDYPKLHKQCQAELLRVVIVSFHQLHKDLIEYDTKYILPDYSSDLQGGICYYKLPKTNLLHLTFVGNKGIPFCTIRKYTTQKFAYYKKLIRKKFNIIIQ